MKYLCQSLLAVIMDKYFMKNLDIIAEELFNKIRGRFQSVTIGNENGEVTNIPKEARFYDFDYKEADKSLGKVSVSLTDENVSIMYSNDFVTNEDQITKNNWYNFLKELRIFAKKRLLNFDTRDITKSNLDKRDYKFLARNRPGELTMESKMYGTSKTSYQNIGTARLAIKHSKPVNTESVTGRIQNVKAIYIESEDGERFRYPAKHLNGARAMARHVAEGGKPYDDFGKHITSLSEELSNLKKFKSYVNRSGVVAEGLGGYLDVVNERMNAVKKTIHNLQKESAYKEAFEGFEITEFKEVPDDVAENWIDQLTVKQFNEELKDVFPYIYRLVSEATKAKALGPEDLLGEEPQEDLYVVKARDTVYDLSRRSGTPVEDIIEINGLDDNASIRVGQQLIIPGINQIGASPTTPGSTRGIDPRDNYSSDDFQRLTRGSPAESFEAHMEEIMGQFSEESNQYEITPQQRKMAQIGHKMRHGLEPSSGIDWEDKDFNLAAELSTQLIQLGTSFGPKTIAAALNNVGEMGIDVEEAQRLIRHAMGEEKETSEGRKRDVDGDGDIDSDDYMAARDVAIKKAMRGKNGEKEVNEQQLPLSEFILGYFDRASGQFPKGETAVLTMIEKEYGEQFINPAKRFIEMVNNKVAEMYGYKDPDLEEDDLDSLRTLDNPRTGKPADMISNLRPGSITVDLLSGYLDWLRGIGATAHMRRAADIMSDATNGNIRGNLNRAYQALVGDRFHRGMMQNYQGHLEKGTTDVGQFVDFGVYEPADESMQEQDDIMRLAGLEDNELDENPEQDLNQEILGFMRYLMQQDRQLGYRASDLARQHSRQPKMALQALQSDPEINKMWQAYSNMNTMTNQPQNMNTMTNQPRGLTQVSDDIADESALMGHIGQEKYGKKGMAALSKAGRDGASEEELGRIKDKYKNDAVSEDLIDINTIAKLAGLV